MSATEILRAFKFTLDPTQSQIEDLCRHAGAARWAFNHALGTKVAAHQEWRRQVAALVESGAAEAEARKTVKVRTPSAFDTQKALNAIKGDSRKDDGRPEGWQGPERPCPWWHEVSTYAFQSACANADRAWKNWQDSLKGKRAGRKVGYPRFKKKGRARDTFRLHHDVKKPTIRLDGYRRLVIPRIGSVRIHDSGKRLARLISRKQAVVQSVTISRSGHRWYASVLCKVQQEIPEKPTRRQAERGTVGVDLGVKVLAALSKPLDEGDPESVFVANPRHLRKATKRLAKAQRSLSRTRKGSARRVKAARRVGRAHHQVAVRRASALHQTTKRLATCFSTVAVEDLNVAGMTRSSRGTMEAPGKKVRQKAGLNRSILDAAPGEFRRQLDYKTVWYGSKLAVLDRWFPSSKTCSDCGWQNPRLTLSDRTFHCDNCNLSMDRDTNAARNIARHAVVDDPDVARDTQETLNARGAGVRPGGPRAGRHPTMKREGTPERSGVPPQRGDPLALPLPTQMALWPT